MVSEAHSLLLQIIHQVAHAKTTVICHNFRQLCLERYQPTILIWEGKDRVYAKWKYKVI